MNAHSKIGDKTFQEENYRYVSRHGEKKVEIKDCLMTMLDVGTIYVYRGI